jgi:glycosyltransferase involved in cell wall biosynthesis
LNAGLRQATGEWIARVDADDVMLATRLQTQLQYVRQYSCSVCFSQAIIRDEMNGTESIWQQRSWPIAVWSSLFCNGYGLHPAVMFKKSRIVDAGGYDETFPKAQDYDLFDRLCAAGDVFGYLEEPLLVHRRHGQQISIKGLDEQEQCARRVSLRAMRRYLPDLTEGEALALRWLFLSRENRPASVPANLIDLASRLVQRFLQVHAYRGFGRLVYQSCILSLASRHHELGSLGLKAAAWRLTFVASIRTHNWLLPLRWVRHIYGRKARHVRKAAIL